MSEAGYLTNEEAQKRLKKRDRAIERQREDDVRAVMGTVQGRRFVYHLIYGRCAVLDKSFSGNGHDAWRNGRRAVGLDLTTDLQALAPDRYVEMVEEAIKAAKEDALQRQGALSVVTKEQE